MKYTVIGYYEDNSQPFVAHVIAATPQIACHKAVRSIHKDIRYTLRIVDVFSGHHRGVLGNDKVL